MLGDARWCSSLPWLRGNFVLIAALVCFVNHAIAQQLETLNASYASVTGSRIPLWIAKDAGLFEKYGLNVNVSFGEWEKIPRL